MILKFFDSPVSLVPPKILAKETSTDMVVREASNVTLTCKATGYPEPYVMWRREDGTSINYNGESGEFVPILFAYTIRPPLITRVRPGVCAR